MREKYCPRVQLVAKLVQTLDSHTWKHMLGIRDEVEKLLGWHLF